MSQRSVSLMPKKNVSSNPGQVTFDRARQYLVACTHGLFDTGSVGGGQDAVEQLRLELFGIVGRSLA